MRRTLLIYTSLRFVPLSVAWAFDESGLKKLQTLNECNKCDLSKADLFKAKLSEAKLLPANLAGPHLYNADLFKANLTGVDLTGASMKGAVLDGAVFCRTKTPWGEENSGCLIH